jgi:hypothetical protein
LGLFPSCRKSAHRPTGKGTREASKPGAGKKAIDPSCVFPDASYIDPADSFAKKNLALLDEIFLASGRGEVIADELRTLAQKVHEKHSPSNRRNSGKRALG